MSESKKEKIDRNNKIIELVSDGKLTKGEIAKLVGITNVRLSQILREVKREGYNI